MNASETDGVMVADACRSANSPTMMVAGKAALMIIADAGGR